MAVFDAFRAILLGVAIGVLGALALSRLLSGLLYGVEPGDLPTYVVVVVVLLGIGLLGSYVPARRAATIDCAAALRVD
jgi:ABC-type lipoprotein release transport system permease subunit